MRAVRVTRKRTRSGAEVVDAVAGHIGGVDRRRAGLAEVEEAPQAVPLGSDIAQLQHGFARDLLLDVEIVVLHVRRLDIPVEGEDFTFNVGAAGFIVNGHAMTDPPSSVDRRDYRR